LFLKLITMQRLQKVLITVKLQEGLSHKKIRMSLPKMELRMKPKPQQMPLPMRRKMQLKKLKKSSKQ